MKSLTPKSIDVFKDVQGQEIVALLCVSLQQGLEGGWMHSGSRAQEILQDGLQNPSIPLFCSQQAHELEPIPRPNR